MSLTKYESKEEYKYIENHHCHKSLSHKAKLYVIAVVSNPARFERRYKLFNEFCDRIMKEPHVELVTIE